MDSFFSRHCSLDFEALQHKTVLAKKYKKGAADTADWEALLPAAKRQRLCAYKELPKVARWLKEGKEVVA